MHPEHIKQLILAGMACDYLELDGDGQHFQAIIVSSEFVGKNRVQRQQRVYQTLQENWRLGNCTPFPSKP